MLTLYLGTLGSVLLLVSGVPQVYKLLTTKKSDDISLAMYLFAISGIALLLVHAVRIWDFVFILTNTFSFCVMLIIISLVVHYRQPIVPPCNPSAKIGVESADINRTKFKGVPTK